MSKTITSTGNPLDDILNLQQYINDEGNRPDGSSGEVIIQGNFDIDANSPKKIIVSPKNPLTIRGDISSGVKPTIKNGGYVDMSTGIPRPTPAMDVIAPGP